MFEDLETPASQIPVRQNAAEQMHPCKKCRGTGSVTFGYVNIRKGKCFACNGRGQFKTSDATRKQNRVQAAVRKANKAESNWESFVENQPVAAEWLAKGRGNFAVSLKQAVEKYGDLTERQLAAVMNIVAKDSEKRPPAKAAAVLDLSPVFAKFTKAVESGLKSPKLRLEGLCFTLAKKGANAGSLYVKAGPAYEDTYLGKVSQSGEFFKSRDCDQEKVDQLVNVSQDVLEAAKAYGQKTGSCSCCGRELTNHDSIELGIGPICADKWGM